MLLGCIESSRTGKQRVGAGARFGERHNVANGERIAQDCHEAIKPKCYARMWWRATLKSMQEMREAADFVVSQL